MELLNPKVDEVLSCRYKADIKRGFLKIDKCQIELETLEIEIDL